MYPGVVTDEHGSGNGAADYCCLEQAALDSLIVPVVIHDAERILYLNRPARALLATDDPHPGLDIDDIVAPSAAEASAERRQILLDTGADLGATRVKVEIPGAGPSEIVSRGSRICYGEDHRHALVHVICCMGSTEYYDPNGNTTSSFISCDEGASLCLHRAAYEALPVPSSVVDKKVAVRLNRAFRALLAAKGPVDDMPLDRLVHPDFAEAGEERRHLVMDLGATVENTSVKLRAMDDSDLYLTVDATPMRYEGSPYMVTLARHATRL